MKANYYRRTSSGTLSQRHANTSKVSNAGEAIAFVVTLSIIIGIVVFNVWVNGVH